MSNSMYGNCSQQLTCAGWQGGVMAATLAAQQVAGMALQTVPKLKFVVCIGSAMTAHPRHLEAMTGRVQLPSCHIIGHKDYIKEYSIELVRQFQAPIVIMHGRGMFQHGT